MKQTVLCRAGIAAVLALSAALGSAAAQAQSNGFELQWKPDPNFKRKDVAAELQNKTTGQYTVVVVGDLLVQEPVGKLIDPKVAQVIRDADTAIGNMESVIVDDLTGDIGLAGNYAPKETAADMAGLGFDLLSGANNHIGDMGMEGMFQAIRLLDEQGIALAGVGRNLAKARQPAFQQTPKGRIALVGAFATSGTGPQIATDRFGNMGGRPGLSPLRLTAWNVVTDEQLRQLKAMRTSIDARRGEVANPVALAKEEPNKVNLFEGHFIAGPKPGDYLYEMNQGDLNSILVNVRNGKEYSDYLTFMVHSHQNPYHFQGFSFSHVPSNFEYELAHKVIDSGADLYAGTGMHTIKGVEIYKGRPIFYGLSGFVFHENLVEMDPRVYLAQDDNPLNPKKTALEVGEVDTERQNQPISLEALLARMRYDNGKLVEVRIYPVDLGADKTRSWSRQGVPMTPAPAKAREILERLQKLSEPFGTRMDIENGIGVIRL
jgi:hypothetical protein